MTSRKDSLLILLREKPSCTAPTPPDQTLIVDLRERSMCRVPRPTPPDLPKLLGEDIEDISSEEEIY